MLLKLNSIYILITIQFKKRINKYNKNINNPKQYISMQL